MLNFKSFGLSPTLLPILEQLEIVAPTPVQEQAIPAALAGADILATAQTGTGKTLAYLLPLVTKMQDSGHERALILAPTRELAEQIKNALLSLLSRKDRYDVALLIGGASLFKQFMALKSQPRFIIGTPGRIIDHLERGKLSLHEVRFLVLDEVDRMLDMGFAEDLETILQDVPTKRQTLMFSATLPPNIAKISKKYLREPKHITIGSTTQAALQIKQEMIKTTAGERFSCLLKELSTREGSVIIFVKTKISADMLAEKLQDKEHLAEAIHGDLRQRQREAVIRSFRKGSHRIMVATDIAARGLDIPHIKHVINYDLPQSAEDYIHRIGRTGRAGMEGFALSFVLPNEGGKWRAIHRLLNSDPSTAYVGDNQGGGWEPRSGGRSRSGARGGRSAGGRSRSGEHRGDRGSDRGRASGESWGAKRRPADQEGAPRQARADWGAKRRPVDQEAGSRPARADWAAKRRPADQETGARPARADWGVRRRPADQEAGARPARADWGARRRSADQEGAPRSARADGGARRRPADQEAGARPARADWATKKRSTDQEGAPRQARADGGVRKRTADPSVKRKPSSSASKRDGVPRSAASTEKGTGRRIFRGKSPGKPTKKKTPDRTE